MSKQANLAQKSEELDTVDARAVVVDQYDEVENYSPEPVVESPPTPKRPAGEVLLDSLPASPISPRSIPRSKSAGEVMMGFKPKIQKVDEVVEAEDVFSSLDDETDRFVFTENGATDSVKHFFSEEITLQKNKANGDQVDANLNAGNDTSKELEEQYGMTTYQMQDKSCTKEKRENEFRYKMDYPERGCFIIFNQQGLYGEGKSGENISFSIWSGKVREFNESQGDFFGKFLPPMNQDPSFILAINFDLYNEKRLPKYHLSYRKGSSKDAANLEFMAKQLGFEAVRTIHDSTKSEIMQWIVGLSEADHSQYDCFACAILTHGGDRDILYSRDEQMKLSDFTRPFGPDNCPSLALKPKLFFIQACRGTKTDSGAKVKLASNIQTDQVDAAGPMDTVDGKAKIVTIPAEADYLIANSTVPEYYSFRNTSNGSIFIQNVCAVFNSFGDSLEIMQLMTRVNRMMAYDFESNTSNEDFNEKKQIPSIATRLTAEVYFKPKKAYQESSAMEEESQMVVDGGISIRTECVEIESGGSRVESTMIELESEQTVEYRSSSALSKQQKANKSFYPPPITTRKRLTFTVPTPQKQGSPDQLTPPDAAYHYRGSAGMPGSHRPRSASATVINRARGTSDARASVQHHSGPMQSFHKSSTEGSDLAYLRAESGNRYSFQRHSSPENRRLVTQQSGDLIMVGRQKTKKIYLESDI